MIKILNSSYNPETRLTIVDIQTPEGIFRGQAKAAPNEKLNDEIGEMISFWRAYIKYLKFLIRQSRDILKELTYMYDHSRKFDPTARKLKQRIEYYQKVISKLKKFKGDYELAIETFIKVMEDSNE